MLEKLELLEQKIDSLIQALADVKAENETLKTANETLEKQFSDLQKEYEQVKLTENDQTEKMKTSLTRILNRLNELEQIAS